MNASLLYCGRFSAAPAFSKASPIRFMASVIQSLSAWSPTRNHQPALLSKRPAWKSNQTRNSCGFQHASVILCAGHTRLNGQVDFLHQVSSTCCQQRPHKRNSMTRIGRLMSREVLSHGNLYNSVQNVQNFVNGSSKNSKHLHQNPTVLQCAFGEKQEKHWDGWMNKKITRLQKKTMDVCPQWPAAANSFDCSLVRPFRILCCATTQGVPLDLSHVRK